MRVAPDCCSRGRGHQSDVGQHRRVRARRHPGPRYSPTSRSWLTVPVIVLEILLGILVGPAVFGGLAQSDVLVEAISQRMLCRPPRWALVPLGLAQRFHQPTAKPSR